MNFSGRVGMDVVSRFRRTVIAFGVEGKMKMENIENIHPCSLSVHFRYPPSSDALEQDSAVCGDLLHLPTRWKPPSRCLSRAGVTLVSLFDGPALSCVAVVVRTELCGMEAVLGATIMNTHLGMGRNGLCGFNAPSTATIVTDLSGFLRNRLHTLKKCTMPFEAVVHFVGSPNAQWKVELESISLTLVSDFTEFPPSSENSGGFTFTSC